MPDACFAYLFIGVVIGGALGGFLFAYLGADREADRWRRGAKHGLAVLSYVDGNEPTAYLVVNLDEVVPGLVELYDVVDTRDRLRMFRVSIAPLELVPPRGGSGTAPPDEKTGDAG